MTQIILASKSPRRISLLKKEGISFRIFPSNINEKSRYKKPAFIVKELAEKKAESVSAIFPSKPVLAADTAVYVAGKILGKPKNKKNALRLLKIQNNKKQAVYTGVCLIWKNKNIKLSETTVSYCYARKLSNDEIKRIAGKHLDKAGGYAVQDKDDEFIRKISGDFDNVVGLPMRTVRKFLKQANIKVKNGGK